MKACRTLKIAVVGDLMLDVYLSGTANRMSQEAPVPILHVKNKNYRLGGAANVMRNITALDASALAFGMVGKDEPGTRLKTMLREGNISEEAVFSDPTRRTTEKLRVMAASQQLVRIDFEDVSPVDAKFLDRIEKALVKQIRNKEIDAVIFEDYNKGLLEKEMVQRVVSLAREYGIYTSLDPHPGHPMTVRGFSIMTPNRSEAFGLAGMYCHEAVSPVEKDENLHRVAERVLKEWQSDALLITLGAQGMALFREDAPMHAIPTKAREVFDVSGAGDTVIATYTMCIAAGATAEEAAEIANSAAGIVVGKIGTATTTPEELRETLRKT